MNWATHLKYKSETETCILTFSITRTQQQINTRTHISMRPIFQTSRESTLQEVNINCFLLLKQHVMKISGGKAPHINLNTRWKWAVNFKLQLLYHMKEFPVSHWIKSWIGQIFPYNHQVRFYNLSFNVNWWVTITEGDFKLIICDVYKYLVFSQVAEDDIIWEFPL